MFLLPPSRKKGRRLAWCLIACIVAVCAADTTLARNRSAADAMRDLITASISQQRFVCQGEIICGISMIPSLYEQQAYTLFWPGAENSFPLADRLIQAIRAGTDDGLDPSAYHLKPILTLLETVRNKQASGITIDVDTLINLDLLLTDAFLLNASHLAAGRVNPETIHTKWVAFTPDLDLEALFREAMATGEILETLQGLRPSHPGYTRLQQALRRFRAIAGRGGWPSLPIGSDLETGMNDARVVLLRQRLALTDDLVEDESSDQTTFDSRLETAVRRFQERHGLVVDGVVGLLTRAELNVTAEDRMEQIILNLERWRWIPRDLGDRYILVNIADFRLQVVEHRAITMEKRVVVGTTYRLTPVFSDQMHYIVINPYWNVPFNIAAQDILPRVRRDAEYLGQNNIRVFDGWGKDAPEIEPQNIEWSSITRENLRYRFRQDPGPGNSLGRIKFMFPNRFSVYLHDTPDQHLFDRSLRDFSSGCIRVEGALDLAAYLLHNDPFWTRETVQAAADSGLNQVIQLQQRIPVHMQYWTAWVGEDNIPQFRYDIYKRDAALAKALEEKMPLVAGYDPG